MYTIIKPSERRLICTVTGVNGCVSGGLGFLVLKMRKEHELTIVRSEKKGDEGWGLLKRVDLLTNKKTWTLRNTKGKKVS